MKDFLHGMTALPIDEHFNWQQGQRYYDLDAINMGRLIEAGLFNSSRPGHLSPGGAARAFGVSLRPAA